MASAEMQAPASHHSASATQTHAWKGQHGDAVNVLNLGLVPIFRLQSTGDIGTIWGLLLVMPTHMEEPQVHLLRKICCSHLVNILFAQERCAGRNQLGCAGPPVIQAVLDAIQQDLGGCFCGRGRAAHYRGVKCRVLLHGRRQPLSPTQAQLGHVRSQFLGGSVPLCCATHNQPHHHTLTGHIHIIVSDSSSAYVMPGCVCLSGRQPCIWNLGSSICRPILNAELKGAAGVEELQEAQRGAWQWGRKVLWHGEDDGDENEQEED